MTAATLLAAAAGGVAALGVTDLAQAWSATRRAPAPSRLALALLARAGRGLTRGRRATSPGGSRSRASTRRPVT